MLLVIAVSIVLVMKGELASKTVNCDTKTKYQIEPQVWFNKDAPGERTGFRSSQS